MYWSIINFEIIRKSLNLLDIIGNNENIINVWFILSK